MKCFTCALVFYIAKMLIKNIWQLLFTAEIWKIHFFFNSLKAFLSLMIVMIDKSFALYWCFYTSEG